MKKHNKLLLVLLICIYSLPTNAKVFISEWSKRNGLLESAVSIVVDYQKRIWLNKGYTDTAYYFNPATLEKTYVPGLQIPAILDPFNNIIFSSSTDGINDSYKLYTKEGEIKQFGKGVTSFMGEHFYTFANQRFCFIDNYAYFGMNLVGFPVFYYMKYDTLNKVWYFDEKDSRVFYPYQNTNDTIMLFNYVGFARRSRELLIPTVNKGIFAFNHDTRKHRFIKNSLFEIFREKNIRLGEPYIDKKEVITWPLLYKKRPAILRLFPNDSIAFFHSKYEANEVYKKDTSEAGVDALMISASLSPVDTDETEFLFATMYTVIYFSEKEGFKYIPKPPEADDFSWKFICQILICRENEVWLSSVHESIIRCNLDELLATRTEVFPGGLADATTEDLIPGVPVMSIYKVKPQPAKDYVDCSYFVQEGKFGDISVKIFDAAGKEYKSDKYEIIAELGVSKTLRVYAKGLPAGTYIIQIQDGANTASEKFIKE